MKKLIVILMILGFAVSGLAADYTIPEGQVVNDVEDAVIVVDYTGYLRWLRVQYEELQTKISYQNELIQNAVATRDSAISAGQAALAEKQALVAERAELIAEYQAIRAAAEAAVTVTGGE